MIFTAEVYYSSCGAGAGGGAISEQALLAGGESFPEEVFTGGFAVALRQR